MMLGLVKRVKTELGEPVEEIDRMIVRAQSSCDHLEKLALGHVEPRHSVKVTQRNQNSAPRRRYYVYLDECGDHAPIDKSGQFPVFCLTAVIIDTEDLARADRLFRTWKAENLGSPHHILHEPELRNGSKLFQAHSLEQRQLVAASLTNAVSQIPFTCIAAALDKREFRTQYGSGNIDDFLPLSTYLLCVDLLLERVLHFLYNVGDDAIGIVMAESRGEREDAEVQSEFLRLQLEGTQYIKHSHFRNQLRPYILFRKKSDNDTGLQLADALARPIAERVISHKPGIIPQRILEGKIYDGGQGRPESYGVKIFPTPADRHPWASAD